MNETPVKELQFRCKVTNFGDKSSMHDIPLDTVEDVVWYLAILYWLYGS